MRFVEDLVAAVDGRGATKRTGRPIATGAAAVLVALACATPAAAQGVEYWGNFGGGTPWLSRTPLSLEGATAIAASNSSSYALVNGSVYAWGRNDHGQLGDGLVAKEREVQSSPVRVTLPVRAVALGEAEGSGAAIDAQGHGWVWGLNPEGAMCVSGSVISTAVETPVENAEMVQGGESHTLWLLANGTVVACGTNKNGELGDNSHSNSSTPVQVLGLAKVVEVSAGELARVHAPRAAKSGIGAATATASWATAPKRTPMSPCGCRCPGPRARFPAAATSPTTATASRSSGANSTDGVPTGRADRRRRREEQTPLPVRTGLKFTSVVASGSSSPRARFGGERVGLGQGAAGEGAGQDALAPVLMRSGATAISGTARDEESLGAGGWNASSARPTVGPGGPTV